MKKRILCIFLTVCMLFALATPAWAAEVIESGQCGDNLNWSLTSDGTLTISGTGAMWDYEFGEDMQPTSPWYKYWASDLGTELKALVISDGVTSIGNYAFMNCKSFTGTLLIPNSVTSIGQYAFYSCDGFDGDLILPQNIASIGNSAFGGCSGFTGTLTIPASITMLGDYVFYNAKNITRIHFDGNAPKIGNNTFSSNLTLEVPTNSTSWTVPTWNGYTTEWYTPETVISGSCGDNLTWTLDGEGTLTISGAGAMWDWTITDVRPWEDSCFDIKTVVIGAGVTHIGNYAFRSCIGSERIEMPDGLLTIGDCAFSQCYGLTNVEIPDSVRSIGRDAFELCQALSELHIGNGVTSIGSGAFSRCNSLTCVEIPSGLSAIPDDAFRDCSNLASVEIPDGITNIGSYAFYHSAPGNQALKNIIIPASVTKIGAAVFDGCAELTDIYYTGSEAQWKLVNINSDNQQLFAATLHFKASGTAGLEYTLLDDGTYEVSGIGSASDQNIVIPATHNEIPVTSISDNAFMSCAAITSINMPDSITSIGQGAFAGCSNLESVQLSNHITSISDNLFLECRKLTDITIPEGVTGIGEAAFKYCIALPEIIIPDSVTDIDTAAFNYCNSLTSVTIPGSVKEISASVFASCGNLETVIFQNGATTVGPGMFVGCEKLTSVILSDTIVSIEDSAFSGCSSLTNLELPASVEYIGYGAFSWCENLNSLTISNAKVVFESESVAYTSTFSHCSFLTDIYFGGNETQWIVSGGQTLLEEAKLNPTVHYSEEKTVASGVLRSGDGWSINWSVTYTINNDSGIISDGALKIEAIGSGEESDLYIFSGAGGRFPWESEPYNIPKTAIKSIDIRGNLAVDLRVTTNAFKGYSNLKTLNCSFVSGIDSSAFEGCDSLTTVKIAYAGDAFSYGANVFADCSNLSSVTFPKSLQYINAGAFRNTALGTITLDEGLVEIGAGAFSGCDKLIIRCYKGSVAYQYAVSNRIPFKLMSEGELETKVPLSNGDKTIYLDIHWNPDEMFSGKSGIYDNNLAIAGLALSAASEGGLDAINETLTAMGFLEDPRRNDNYAESGGPGISMPAHSIASMPIIIDGQEKTLITLVVRGTDFASDDFWTDIKALGDGFADSGTYVFESVCDYIDRNYANDDVILFVTGHSLGGAVAGVVADLCSHRYSDANVFSYTFATPNNSYTEISRSNVHNIINACDLVPAFPPNYNEIGTNYYYMSKSNLTFIKKYSELFGTFPDQNPFNLIVNHLTDTYMALLLSDTPLSSTEEYGYRLVRILCPVDVKVYDSTGTLVGSVVNDEVDTSLLTTEVFIETYGDEKYIYLFNDVEYSFELIGTGTGTMTYYVQDIAIDGTILEEKSYQNVVLSNGKEMASNVGGTTNTPDIHLYVLGENDEPIKIVLPDGNGTEIPIAPTEPSEPTYPTGGGSATPSYSISVPTDFTGGSVSVTPSHASAGSTVIITATPEDGYVLDQLKVTDANGDELVLTDKGDGNYSFTMPSEKVNVEVSFKEIPKNPFSDVTTDSWFYDAAMFVYERGLMNGIDADLFGPDIATTRGMLVTILWRQDGAPEAIYDGELNDVPDTMYYAPAVKWAATNGIMGGYGNGKFGPDDPITREQMAAILWRYAQYKGYDISVTEDSISDFNDVSAISDYAAPAMQWVCSEGIMFGKPGKILDPTGTAKRSEIATMLMRFLENVK